VGERRETREMDRAIRAHWARVIERFEVPLPLVAHCESWIARSAATPVEFEALRPTIATETREREQPPDLYTELRQVTPQAILRDLHRPETTYGITGYDRFETGWDPGGVGATSEIRSAIRQSYDIDLVSLLATQRTIDADLTELRSIKALPWNQAPRLTATPRDESAEGAEGAEGAAATTTGSEGAST
jgi:hypothetical protein